MSSAALVHGPLALFTSCSSRVAITFFVNNIEFSLSNATTFFFVLSFLSAGRRVVRPKFTDLWLTHTTHNLAWMALPGARHAGKGLHHRVQSV